MRIAFFHGPDREPFELLASGIAVSAPTRPCHGIVSRGLLTRLAAVETGLELWSLHGRGLDGPTAGPDQPSLARLQGYARVCGVLSFQQSASCARLALERYCRDRVADEAVDGTLWKIKEGHTSSVWQATVSAHAEGPSESFILNVARDRAAGQELRATAESMRCVAEYSPQINMAKVLEVGTVSLTDPAGLMDVVVTRNELIPDAREIHAIRDAGGEREQFVLIERFITDPRGVSCLPFILGRRARDSESATISRDIARFIEAASRCCAATLQINDGDVVWNGATAIVVAIS